MISTLRRRLLVALGLTCAVSPTVGCSGGEDELRAVPVDREAKKPISPAIPPTRVKKSWVPEVIGYAHGGAACTSGTFCTNAPDVAQVDYGDECGQLAKLPKGVGADELEGEAAGFNRHVTDTERRSEPGACCYSYRRGACGKGRPLRNEGELVVAPQSAAPGWSGLDPAEAAAIARAVRARASSAEIEQLTRHLRRMALLEHASVAAFARVSLELLAFGAPAELVEAAHAAALDEIRHARVCFALVEALEGAPFGPGPLPIPPLVIEREEALVSTIVDGCIGETVGSLLLEEAARVCTIPSLAAMYRAIADEEAEHAALAFRIVRFLAPDDPVSIARAHVFEGESVEPLTALGILPRETERAIEQRASSELVLPLLSQLAGHSQNTAPRSMRTKRTPARVGISVSHHSVPAKR